MANEDVAIDYVLHQEDSRMSGVITTDAGGRTRYGVAEKYHPELTHTGFFDTMENAPALSLAKEVYLYGYCKPLCIQSINVQQVANASLSFGLNQGVSTSVVILQKTLRSLGNTITVDGKMGLQTVGILNLTDASKLLVSLGTSQRDYYLDIVARNPSCEKDLNGWLNRVARDCILQA